MLACAVIFLKMSSAGSATTLVGGYRVGFDVPPSSVPCVCLCMFVNSASWSVDTSSIAGYRQTDGQSQWASQGTTNLPIGVVRHRSKTSSILKRVSERVLGISAMLILDHSGLRLKMLRCYIRDILLRSPSESSSNNNKHWLSVVRLWFEGV